MNAATQSEVLKIRKFGRYARASCLALTAVAVIFSAWMLWSIAAGPGYSGFTVDLGAYEIRGDQIAALGVKTWASTVVAVVTLVTFNGLFHLYRLFDNLASGAIYTKENVRHIRQLGLLALAMAVLEIVLPLLSALVLQAGLIAESAVTPVAGRGDSLMLFITAGLILLASWIMEVGRQTSDEAEELRRDAELVV